jgi:hypothetical protein
MEPLAIFTTTTTTTSAFTEWCMGEACSILHIDDVSQGYGLPSTVKFGFYSGTLFVRPFWTLKEVCVMCHTSSSRPYTIGDFFP